MQRGQIVWRVEDTLDGLSQRYHGEHDGTVKVRWHALWLLREASRERRSVMYWVSIHGPYAIGLLGIAKGGVLTSRSIIQGARELSYA